jgi:hypothetical protein
VTDNLVTSVGHIRHDECSDEEETLTLLVGHTRWLWEGSEHQVYIDSTGWGTPNGKISPLRACKVHHEGPSISPFDAFLEYLALNIAKGCKNYMYT